jgi:hypothetical protein
VIRVSGPGEQRGRSASPFFYAGLATRYEDERLTEDDRDNPPERINALRSRKFGTWRSEREWIPIMLETASAPRRLMLKLGRGEVARSSPNRDRCEEADRLTAEQPAIVRMVSARRHKSNLWLSSNRCPAHFIEAGLLLPNLAP